MTASEAILKRQAQHLAYAWVKCDLPNQGLNYADYVAAATGLLLATPHPEQATRIFGAVMNQAVALGRGARWAAAELGFEAAAAMMGDRPAAIMVAIEAQYPVSDDALDLYQARLTRFNQEHL